MRRLHHRKISGAGVQHNIRFVRHCREQSGLQFNRLDLSAAASGEMLLENSQSFSVREKNFSNLFRKCLIR